MKLSYTVLKPSCHVRTKTLAKGAAMSHTLTIEDGDDVLFSVGLSREEFDTVESTLRDDSY